MEHHSSVSHFERPSGVPPASPSRGWNPSAADIDSMFVEIYEAWYRNVRRWVIAFGAPAREVDDAIQEVFIVVRRQLPSFRTGNFGGWLFRITHRTVRDLRRRAWFRHVLLQGAHAELEEVALPCSICPDDYEARETIARLEALLERMSGKLRETFLLFQVEGYTGEEIAALKSVPLATVWTRLYYARRQLAEMMVLDRS